MARKVSRRALLRWAGLVAGTAVAAACTPEIVVETVVKEVEKVVKETVIIEGEEKVIEKVVKETVIVEKEAEEPVGFQGVIQYHTRIPPQTSTGPGIPNRVVPQLLATAWEALHPGIKIEFVESPGGQTLTDWINTQLIGGTGPNCA